MKNKEGTGTRDFDPYQMMLAVTKSEMLKNG